MGAGPTLMQVAQRAGVSIGTASAALASRPSVAGPTRDAVLAAALELGYRPLRRRARKPGAVPPPAAGLRQLTAVGLVAAEHVDVTPTSPYHGLVLRGVQRACADLRLSLSLETIPPAPADPGTGAPRRPPLPLCVARGQVQGVVVIGGGDSHEFTRQLLQAGVHVVEVDHADAHLPSDAVLHDDERAGRLATRRLVELGHVDPVPAVIAGPQSLRVAAERLAGYRTALAEAGLRDDPRSVLTTDFGVVEGAGAMRRLLALPVPPTAVVCGNDELAAGALAVLRERGIAVPGEVSVVGCDDVGPAARLVPGLTTVHLDCEAAGNQAVWQLVQRSRRPERARIVLRLDVRLVERASTGPPRARP